MKIRYVLGMIRFPGRPPFRKDEEMMKKWICAVLCLSMIAGMVSMDVTASAEDNTKENAILVRNTGAAGVDTPSIETPAIETPAPTAAPVPIPPFTGNLTVNSQDVFTVVVNSGNKTCTITGYKGNSSATTIYIPAKINGNTVVSVSDKVFSGCYYLKNLVVKGDVEFQGNGVFSSGAAVEIWGKSGGRTASYAASSARQFHPIEGPSAISGKKAASLNKATITWSAVNGAVSYNVYRKRGKDKFSLYKNVAATTFTNEKLKVGAKYTYKVNPVFTASNGETIEGNGSKEAAVSLVPAKLKGVRAKGVRGGIQVRWKRNKNVSGYQVFMKVHVKGFKTKFNRVKTIKKNKTTGYRCRMLVRGMKYSYKVRSYKTVKGKKIFSPFVTVTTKAR